MLCAVEMFGRMLVLRGIAAADVAAFQAETQVYPCVSEFDAIFTDMFVRADQLDMVEMIALSHNCLHSIQFRCRESAMVHLQWTKGIEFRGPGRHAATFWNRALQ